MTGQHVDARDGEGWKGFRRVAVDLASPAGTPLLQDGH
jgi:hypothetical protein